MRQEDTLSGQKSTRPKPKKGSKHHGKTSEKETVGQKLMGH